MAFPQVQDADTQSGTQTSDSTTWSLPYPTNLAVNDLILAVLAVDGGIALPTFPATWIRDRDVGGSSLVTCVVGKKISLGTETGNFTVTISAAEQGCWRVLRIIGWGGIIGTTLANDAGNGGSAIKTAAAGTSSGPDPPAMNPAGWDVEDTLWIAAGASDGGDTTYTGFPASYTNTSAQESGGTDGAALGTARLESAVSTGNPGAFTTDVSVPWAGVTIAIRPGSAGLATGKPPLDFTGFL